jgi:hypothetical protein
MIFGLHEVEEGGDEESEAKSRTNERRREEDIF